MTDDRERSIADYGILTQEFCASFGGRGWQQLADLLDTGYKGEFVALRLLRDSTADTAAGDLARQMHISTARVAAILRSLSRKKFIRRLRSKTDRRSVVVTITPAGLDALAQREAKVHAFIEASLRKLSPDEAETFLHIARKMFA